jgi:chaperonin GroEL (HSP60 family)
MQYDVYSMVQSRQLFGEGFRRTQGNPARRYNLLAARLIADIAKGLLGPRGMEKMFIDILGETTVTKDGATLLRKLDVEHPAAKVIIESSNAVDNEVGDGTISVVVFAGALIQKADELMDYGISPSSIADGYSKALEFSLKIAENLSEHKDNPDGETMLCLARTCLYPKLASMVELIDNVAGIVVNAVIAVSDLPNNRAHIDNIKIEEKIGNSSETRLVDGIVIDKTIDNPAMPKSLNNVKILLLDQELEEKNTRIDAEVRLDSATEIKQFLRAASTKLRKRIQNIIDSGANVVISRKGINLIAQQYLAEAKIISLRRVKENDIHWIEKATGAKVINDIDNISLEPSLGYAGSVYERDIGGDKMVFIERCINPHSVTILLRASTKVALDEFHRSALSAIHVLRDFIIKPDIVYGGGSFEAIVANEIRKLSTITRGRRQIVMEGFADALDEIPLTIAKNAGMDELDTKSELRAKTYRSLGSKVRWFGINPMDRKIDDMRSNNIVEPSFVKEQVLKTAVESTILLVRVDDVLMMRPVMNTHTHADGTQHAHAGGDKKHDHYFDKLGKQQRPMHHYY